MSEGRVPFRRRPAWEPRVKSRPMPINGRPLEDQQVKDWLSYLFQGQEEHGEQLRAIEAKLDRVLELFESHHAWRQEIESLRRRAPWWIVGLLASVSCGLASVLAAVFFSRYGVPL